MSDKIKDIMKETVGKIKEIVDVNSVVGTPIKVTDSVTIIPISRISYGIGTGGSDFQNKMESSNPFFGGICGTGVTISPVGFLSISGENVTFLQVESFNGAIDRLIAMTPDLINKISNSIKERRHKSEGSK